MPPPPPSIAGKARCFFSFAAMRDRCFSRRFLAAGLRPLAIQLPDSADPVTTVHMWVPTRPPRNPLVLLHGFGASATWQWYPYLRPLIAAGFDPIVPDLVFFGNSCTRLPDRSDTFQAWSIKTALDAIGVTKFGLVGVSYGGFVGYRMAAMYPDAVERVAMVCAGVCLEEKNLAEGLFPVAGVDEAAALLVPRRPEEVRRLVRLTFVRPPFIMPSCFLWDYIKVMGSDHIQEKTELLHALISGRQLSTLPKLRQVWLWFQIGNWPRGVPATREDTVRAWCIIQDQGLEDKKTARALCLLGMWMIWKHRNDVVFNGIAPSVETCIRRIEEEGKLWAIAGLLQESGGLPWVSRE